MLALFGAVSGNAQTTSTAIGHGAITNLNAVYLTARNATTGIGVESTFDTGQQGPGTFFVWRSFFAFPIGALTGTVAACSLYVDGHTDGSTTDFNIYLLNASGYKSEKTTADFDQFDGWQASGAYNGTILNNTWNSSSYSANWNIITFNQAGIDLLTTAANDTLWIVALSEEDYNASEPAAGEFVIFNTVAAAAPYISFSYSTGWAHTASGIATPANVWGVDKANISNINGVAK